MFLLEDDRVTQLASVPAQGGPVRQLTEGRRFVGDYSIGADGKIAVLSSMPGVPEEVFALEGGQLRPLSRQNDAWLSKIQLAPVEEISFKSRDGTPINGFLVRPVGFQTGTRVPTVLRIHGGPVYQFSNEFSFEWQLLAAQGFAVVAANPRGSSGRGEKFALGIWADWGNKDSQDVLAAVDYAIAQGVADPKRLGVGGWSYGGILTNQVIARDSRFKAAISGAGQSNALAGYGTDQYVREYEAELGKPWTNSDTYDQSLLSLLPRRPDRYPDALHVWGQGFQCSAAQLRADVPGVTEPGSRGAAGDLPGRVPPNSEAQL